MLINIVNKDGNVGYINIHSIAYLAAEGLDETYIYLNNRTFTLVTKEPIDSIMARINYIRNLDEKEITQYGGSKDQS